jgi:CHAD domain-containing protein
MADALSEVTPCPGWRKLKKASRDLFHALGDLRDTQVERSLVKKFGVPSDPLRKHMMRQLAHEGKKRWEAAEKALDLFDRKKWRRCSRKLLSKSHFFPLESVVFQRIALDRLDEAACLYQEARKRRSAAAWHRTRIGIKRFRYIVENFLPRRYKAWAEDLEQMQDLLGDLHDMDVLRMDIRQQRAKFGTAIVAPWIEKIDAQRKTRLQEFLAKTSVEHSPWVSWRTGLQPGHVLLAASFPHRQTA